METLKEIVPLVLVGSLATLVFAVGLDSTLGELLALFKAPKRLLKAVLAVNVAVPLAAIALVALFPIPRPAAAAILLMSISPVPPLAPGKQLKVGGAKPYSYSVYTALILLAVVIVPLSALLLERLYGVDLALPPLAVARSVAMTVVLPLLLGLLVRRLAPGLAQRLPGALRAIAMLLIIVAAIPLLIGAWPVFAPMIGDGTLAVIVLVVMVALATGHLLGGPDPHDRATLAVTAATRHPGIALMIAKAASLDPRIPAAVLGFMIVGLIAALPYQAVMKRRLGRAAAASTPPPRAPGARRATTTSRGSAGPGAG